MSMNIVKLQIMSKSKALLILIVLVVVGLPSLLIISYQRLVDEGSVIADNECLIVNPLLIERKNSYLKSMKVYQTSGIGEEYLKEIENYRLVAQKYVNAQKEWLKIQGNYINRWDFKLVVPPAVKNAILAQYTAREADMNAAITMIELIESRNTQRQTELTKIIAEQTKKAKESNDKSSSIYFSPRTFDFRIHFTKIPQSKCSPENFDFPDTFDPFKFNTLPGNEIYPKNNIVVGNKG